MTLVYKILLFAFAAMSLFMGPNVVVGNGIDMIYNLEFHDADTEIWLKADLGGFVFGGAILLLLGAIKEQGVWIQAVLVSVTCIFVARVYGVAVHGLTETQTYALLLEAAMIVVFYLASRHFDALNAVQKGS